MTEEQEKSHAIIRLASALHYCEGSRHFDKEEIDHLDEIFRIIDQKVPAYYFKGFCDFMGPDNDPK